MAPRAAKKAKATPASEPESKSKPKAPEPKSKRVKRPAEDATEAAQEVPSKAPRTALGKAKQQNVVTISNGLNNNGPLDEQPEVAAPKPGRKRAAAAPETAKAAPVLNSVPPAKLYCFGNNDCGQLGLSSEVEKRKFPALVPALAGKKIIGVASGGMHTLALEDNGKVWSWGVNDDKALGRVTEEEEDGFEPALVDLPAGIKASQITAGDSHSAALTSEGDVYVWGTFKDTNGNFGLVADKGEICRLEPVNITPRWVDKITKIASGGHHIAMLSENGRLYTCGTGDQGQLGRQKPLVGRRVTRSMGLDAVEDKIDRNRLEEMDKKEKKDFLLKPTLVKIGRNAKVKDIWTGEFSTYCCAENGRDVYVFGLNNYSQLGIPSTSLVVPVPTKTTSLTRMGKTWKQISAGQHHAILLDNEGKVYSLGRSSDGRLGIGERAADAEMFEEPTLIEELSKFKCRSVATGGSTSYAVTEDGKLYAWGFGENWQLATGDEDDRNVPTRSCGGRDKDIEGEVIQITAGGQHVALTILATESTK